MPLRPDYPFGTPQTGGEPRRLLSRNPFLVPRQASAERASGQRSAPETPEQQSGLQSLFRAVAQTMDHLKSAWRNFTSIFAEPENQRPETRRSESEGESPAARRQPAGPEARPQAPANQKAALPRAPVKAQSTPQGHAEEASTRRDETEVGEKERAAANRTQQPAATARRAPPRPTPQPPRGEAFREDPSRPQAPQQHLRNLRRQTQSSTLTRPDARPNAQADLASRSGAASGANQSVAGRKKDVETTSSQLQAFEGEGEDGEAAAHNPLQRRRSSGPLLQRLAGRYGTQSGTSRTGWSGGSPAGPAKSTGQASPQQYGAPKMGGLARLGLAQMFAFVDRRAETEIQVPYSERSARQRGALSRLGDKARAVLRLWSLQMTAAGRQDGAIYLNVEQQPLQFNADEAQLVAELKESDGAAYGGITGKALDREFFAVLEAVTGKSLGERYRDTPVRYATGPLDLKNRPAGGGGLTVFQTALLRLWGSDSLFRGGDPADAATQGLSREEVQALLVADLSGLEGEDSLDYALLGALDKLYYGAPGP